MLLSKKSIFTLIILILILSLVSGCTKKNQYQGQDGSKEVAENKSDTEETNTTPKTLHKIKITQPNFLEAWLPVYIANEKGYFAEEGLEVEFVTVMGGHNVRAAVIAGEAQFGHTGYEQVASTFEQGKSCKMIMTTTKKHPWSYFVGKNIESIADLKGKNIDGGLEGSSYRSFARAVVQFGGLDPNKDVQFVNIPRGSEIAALEKGEVHGALGADSNTVHLINKGFKQLVNMIDDEDHNAVVGSDTYPLFVVMVNDEYIKSNPEQVQAFTNAVVKGMDFMKENNAETIKETIATLFSHVDKEILGEYISLILPALSTDGYVSEEGHNVAIKYALDVEFIKNPVGMEDIVDHSFLDKAHNK